MTDGTRTGTPVLLFPGQSSREPEMIDKLVAADPAAAALVDRASPVLGRDLRRHYRRANVDIFATNRDIQVGVFLANHLHLDALARAGVLARRSIGLSLGEYNHLVHAGAIAFEDALRVVDRRGCLFDAGPPGVTVSVFPIDAARLQAVIDATGVGDGAVIGLFNSPRQQVLSGERSAVEAVLARLEDEVFVEAVILDHRIPMHSPLFAPVAKALRPVLAAAPWRPPLGPYVPNVRGEVCASAREATIVDCLERHVHSPVRWQASVEAVAAAVEAPIFVEVGPRAVLTGMFGRGWNPGRAVNTDAPAWPAHLPDIVEGLRRAVA